MTEPSRCDDVHERILKDVENRITNCHDKVNARIDGRLEEMHAVLDKLAVRIEQHVDSEEMFWEDVRGAFPGSPDTHREWHESVMRREARREQWQNAVIEKSITGLVWSMLVGLAAAVWHSIKDHVR